MAKKANPALKKDILMPGKASKAGFTFLELLVVVLLLGIITAIVIPNFQQRTPKYKRQEFVDKLNALAFLGWQQALQTQKLHRLFFDLDKNIVQLEIEQQKTGGKQAFNVVQQVYQETQYKWPDNIEIKQFVINGVNEMAGGKKVKTIWFFIVPNGLAQEVIINAIDTAEQTAAGKDREIGLVLNPFTAQFKAYDYFAK